MVKSELQATSKRNLKIPSIAEVEMADLAIWLEEVPSLALVPGNTKAQSKRETFWKIGTDFIVGSTYVAIFLI